MSVNASSPPSPSLLCVNIDHATSAIRFIICPPLSIFILYLGFQQWRKQHPFKTASHSDVFAYHLAVMELMWGLGSLCHFYCKFAQTEKLLLVGWGFILIGFYGEMLFHILTCVERYLAVVYPVIYMGLKNTRGVRIRNITIGCVWVLCFVLVITHIIESHDDIFIALFCLLAVSILATCYCSISVLCTLIRPGPGDGGREKERVDQSKQRAFYTITAISSVLWFWFVGLLVAFAVTGSHLNNSCLVMEIVAFCNIPSYLISPLLYLLKAGKLRFTCCCKE